MAARAHIPSASSISGYSSLLGAVDSTITFSDPRRTHIVQSSPNDMTPPRGSTKIPHRVVFDHRDKVMQGVRMSEAWNCASTLKFASATPLGDQGLSEIQLQVTLPGYEDHKLERCLNVAGATTAQLLIMVSDAFEAFMNKVSVYDGKPPAIAWDRLVLVDIHHFGGEKWQAKLAYDAN